MKKIDLKNVEKGSFGLPLLCDEAILVTMHNRDVYSTYEWLCKCLEKKRQKGIELSVDELAESKSMNRLCIMAFAAAIGTELTKEGRVIYKQYMAEKIINEVNDGQWEKKN